MANERAALRLPAWVRWVGQAALFLAAFIPRAVYPVSRPLQWYERSFRFVSAVLSGQWAATVVSEHPGVAPMWLIGLAQHAYYWLAMLLGRQPPHPLDIANRAFETEVAISILPLALAVAVGVLVAWRLLQGLFGEPVAWAGAGFLALDPFHTAISKVVHVDALLSMLMLLSALSVLRHLQLTLAPDGQRRTLWERYRLLIASGALGGLAFLTKSPAYFLMPFLGLSLLVMHVGMRQPMRQLLVTALIAAGVWIGVASAVYVLLWPAMWVQPGPTLATVFAGVLKHAGRAHPQPIYYLGELTTEDPGPGFYALTVLVKTTLLSLPLALVGALASLAQGWRRERRILWLVAAYGLFFFVQMSLGAKKDPRYLLPLFPMLDVLAGVGLVTLASWLARGKRVPAALPIVGLLALQAALVWPYHPYYVTYASPLVGGPAGAQQLLVATPEGEGLDIVARYLNRRPGAERLQVGVQLPAREAFRQVFVGKVLDTREADLDYLVFADVYLTRHVAEDQWGEQWQAVRFRAPEFVAYLHGVPYARLYRVSADPQEPVTPLSLRVGDAVRLLGYTLVLGDGSVAREHAVVNPGDVLLLTLHWDALGQPGGDYSVFVHVLGPDGWLVTQQDNVPLSGTYPTLLWRAGTRVDDPYELRVPEDAAPGLYTLVAGMYDWRTGERLEVRSAEGELLPENRVLLARLDVRDERMPWWQLVAWITSGLLALVGIGVCLLEVDWRSLLRTWSRLRSVLRSAVSPAQPTPPAPRLDRCDGVWLVVLMGGALAARLPYLMQIPRLGDEVFEALQAWEIAYGGARPLIGVNALYGPLFAYGLALCFRLCGSSPVVPRALATVAATATVGLTYLFARGRLGRRWSAAVAAGLVATTPTHILVNSHLGYANSITPLLTTALLIVLVAAVQRRSGPLLVLAGFLGGLSLQTHVSVLPFLFALLIWALARRDGRCWLRTPWPYLALAAWAIAYSPVIAFNLGSGFASLKEPLKHPYAYAGQVGLDRYLVNSRLLAEEIGWIVDGRMSLPAEPVAFRALGAVRLIWLVAGLVLAVRRRDGLLGILLGVTAVVIPAFNNLYTRTMGTRYIAWLLPVLCTAMAAVPEAVGICTQAVARRLAVGVLVVVLVLFPLAPLGAYYTSHVARQRTNSTLLRFSAAAAERNSPTFKVLISSSTDLLYLSNAGTVQSALAYLLTLQRVRYDIVPSADLPQTLQAAPGGPLWLIAEWGEGSELAQAFGLQVVDSGPIGGEPMQRVGLFARPGR